MPLGPCSRLAQHLPWYIVVAVAKHDTGIKWVAESEQLAVWRLQRLSIIFLQSTMFQLEKMGCPRAAEPGQDTRGNCKFAAHFLTAWSPKDIRLGSAKRDRAARGRSSAAHSIYVKRHGMGVQRL